ncbi:unnamed protein product [Arctia plantaginis]|uniref:Uncharacterized protein n=1 Tax=Arctia plantaginis TaxID=874455 RepID=A0A8S0ZNW7_ARCPL|nr:unnamed protein product [Arctia plantaginis]
MYKWWYIFGSSGFCEMYKVPMSSSVSSTPWQCTACKKKQFQVDVIHSPDKTDTDLSAKNIQQAVMNEIRGLRSDKLREFRKKMLSLKEYLKACGNRVYILEERINLAEELESTIDLLKQQLNECEQESLSNEVQGSRRQVVKAQSNYLI